ncbi:MAG TPA: DUF2795 domain-containing protein [Kineosporiaceae bacterium]|nr:DUF2795 domain-containing protein [Kineosporiaceae bacterium]
MSQHTGPSGPEEDEQLKHETRGLVQGGRSSRAQEWRDPEPAGEDQPTGDRHITPDDRRSAPPGMTPRDIEERSELARFLGRAAFPGDRDHLLDVARANDAPDHVISLLEQVEGGQEYINLQAVARAAGIGTETGEH